MNKTELFYKIQSYDLEQREMRLPHKAAKIAVVGTYDMNSRKFEEFDIVVTDTFQMENYRLKEYERTHPYQKRIILFELIPNIVGRRILRENYPLYDYPNMSWKLKCIAPDRWAWMIALASAKTKFARCLKKHDINSITPSTEGEMYVLESILDYTSGVDIIRS